MNNGFTLIELMIVIAILVIIAAMALPNLIESRLIANEAAAAASLKAAIFAGEIQFQGGGYQDADQSGTGEFGALDCLNGWKATSKHPIQPGNIPANSTGIKLLTGPLGNNPGALAYIPTPNYFFKSINQSSTMIATQISNLAGQWTEGTASPAPGTGGNSISNATTSAQNGERFFCVGCSPASYGNSGRRNFFLSQDGIVRSPTANAADKLWMGVANLINNTVPTDISITRGLADAYGPGATWPTAMDNGATPVYPTYVR